MRLDDLTLEVRDRDLKRVGQITPSFLNLKGIPRWCSVGEWTVTLPGDHGMVPHLLTPGSGVILLGPDGTDTGVIFSGPTSVPTRKRNAQNPDGTFTFVGMTDEIHLLDALAYPDTTSGDPEVQAKANDIRTAPTETLLREYVSANISDGAAASRRRGVLSRVTIGGVDRGRGITATKSPRFQNLLELLREIVLLDTSIGFRMVQVDDAIEFQVLDARDRSKFVRFDIENGTLTSEDSQQTGPSVTRAIVAGQGQGEARKIIARTTPEAQEAEALYGRVPEVWIDQRDTNDDVELQQSGDEALTAGAGGTSVKVVPADDTTMQFGVDWRPGDLVTVVVNGVEAPTSVTETVILANPDGVRAGAALGDVSNFDAGDTLGAKVDAIDSRVSRLERVADVRAQEWAAKGGPLAHVGTPAGPYANSWAKGVDSGGSIDAHSDPLRILISEDGVYEVVAMQRAVGAGAYIGIGLNGSREAVADRPEGMWTHDHAGGATSFTNSRYLGPLLAGESITAGPPGGAGDTVQYSAGSFTGNIYVRRIS